MRFVVSAFAVAALLAGCAKDSQDGGDTHTGGKVGTGGAVGTGGKVGTGGRMGTGGTTTATTVPTGPCDDTASLSTTASGQYDHAIVAVDGNPNKTYIFQSNWWFKFDNFKETLSGLSFTFSNPNNTAVSSTEGRPMGFPSFYVGSYGGPSYTSKGSNLPKAVSAITSIPTVFSTNADSMGRSNYNATYDVWFTQSNAAVTGGNPGQGGAYLMVWLFNPLDRRPRGTIDANGHTVEGASGVWDVWFQPKTDPSSSDKIDCVSYVSLTPQPSLEFDLKAFIQDAIKNSWGVTGSQYLSIIFAGFEVWGGGNGLQVKKFCANVQ